MAGPLRPEWVMRTAPRSRSRKPGSDASIEGTEIPANSLSQGVAFFSFLRNMTCDGFYTSKIGIADLQYMGNVPQREFLGCPPPPES